MDCSTRDLELQLRDYRLTTAEIFYRFPDYPAILQAYVWQDLDLAPKFPTLKKFLGFWERELDGKLHSVKIMHADLITPAEYKALGFSVTVH